MSLLRGLCTSAQKVTANGVQLHVVTSGDASLPPLLCMPGGLGTAETDFGPQLRELSDSFQVVSCDPRGYGQSRPPVRDFPPDFYQRDADDAAAVMRALGHERYAVMGWSDGAIAAVMLAASQRAADPICLSEHPRWFADNMADARLHVFPDGKHNIHLKYAAEVNEMVRSFAAP
ncbi:Valacyclovir hydrolase [Emiliania huxleyi CCMP1516]|uniref:AB hydrolase-1 domain-containing protein n=2 Tax=Emiliania huxleyi TaxID=2903 RepID=A0A0D3JNI2_EMIH1|nr:Valacyclovir hydrolase [Emiliania huxleyi CCMP1516]EOD25067.1 Valacyclovir hydrolase [Emiliania huxleyi CCMP1516]|eukprot:XP_005777496.1 Valacyclovir hydrolase [Emiliania huxleyi CCMP1516]